jgi:hypothetical protein
MTFQATFSFSCVLELLNHLADVYEICYDYPTIRKRPDIILSNILQLVATRYRTRADLSAGHDFSTAFQQDIILGLIFQQDTNIGLTLQ